MKIFFLVPLIFCCVHHQIRSFIRFINASSSCMEATESSTTDWPPQCLLWAHYSPTSGILPHIPVSLLTILLAPLLCSSNNLDLLYNIFILYYLFISISSLSALINYYLHLPAISVWAYTIFFHLLVAFKHFLSHTCCDPS